MTKYYVIKLEALDFCQVLEGMEARLEAWQKTADYHRTGVVPDDGFFVIEECNNAEEAEAIACDYRSIIGQIEEQMKEQQ